VFFLYISFELMKKFPFKNENNIYLFRQHIKYLFTSDTQKFIYNNAYSPDFKKMSLLINLKIKTITEYLHSH